MDAQLVKQLRDLTGAGFGDCKKALETANGDFDAAVRHLKEMGLASAAKRAGREANEGRVFGATSEKGIVFLVLGCETDFVARNETFVAHGKKLVVELANTGATELNPSQQDEIIQLGAIIKENIQVKKVLFIPVAPNQTYYLYIHGEEGKKGAWAVANVEGRDPRDPQVIAEIKEFALHAVANDPLYFSQKDVPESYINEQREIFTVQAKGLGKPEAALAKIIEGKLNKHLSEIVYLMQPFLNDAKISVSQAAVDAGKRLGCKFDLVSAGSVTIGG